MAHQLIFRDELESFKRYIRSDSNEDARRPELYPLFKKLFKEKFKIESDACGADVYIEGALLVEAKTGHNQWLDGFYQALHYRKRFGLGYHTIMVIAHRFVGIWKVDKLPEQAVIYVHMADSHAAPNAVGRSNARKSSTILKNQIRDAAIYWLTPQDLQGDIFAGAKNLTTESFEILKILKNLESDRQQINTHNFINTIERMKVYFEHPIDAVHAFYTMVAYWDITCTLALDANAGTSRIIGVQGSYVSDPIYLATRFHADFKRFVESQYIFTNEGSGLTVDYYFSRFDEVMSRIDPEYVRQHGIFFTDINLSKFALWYANQHFPGDINEDYIVFDPAGGSGNLVSSWRGRLRHKIVSELQPDLLRTIERRMQADIFHVDTGFTIIPRTAENRGLNFLDRPASEYLADLQRELAFRNKPPLDKPLAFLLNPPYKNTDEHQGIRELTDSHYIIDPSILALTGADAGNERYLAFLGQILNMASYQTNHLLPSDSNRPVVMIFTPTSWLLPRPTYTAFRQVWDSHFRYQSGFIVTSNEFFHLDGRWPLAFTIWQYERADEPHNNSISVLDLTELKKGALNLNWNAPEEELNETLNTILGIYKTATLDNSKGSIKAELPEILKSGRSIRQPRYDFSTAKRSTEYGMIVSGFPAKDVDRHFKLRRKCGDMAGQFVGFMDDNTPVRLNQDTCTRLSNLPDRIWLQLRPGFIDINLTKVQSGPQDKYAYCAYDLPSSKATMSWFAITKALNGRYPLWANQFDIWPPNLTDQKSDEWYALCMSFVLAENRCITVKFEGNNPVIGAPELFVDNPLCPINVSSFWAQVINPYVQNHGTELAKSLVESVNHLYLYWNRNYCKGEWLYNIGLKGEAYFKFFDYDDFLTPYSGLIQIRKYAELNDHSDLIGQFDNVALLARQVKEEIFRLLAQDYKYFS
ncbi:hypothetical protein [Dyadobacter sp. CY356]|uniref:hypothetical protein n=1 Tax=Dyadobacter sp. CY356 TaxID=2906442 RepID=UPI001F41D3C1|nr:hypothetical protein [Dyadobacter sp. CY356]MCF0057166.1 hypothetical protein [Dyadobacter sp. CY356]